MAKKRFSTMSKEESSFQMAMRSLGIQITNDNAKIYYRVAVMILDKGADFKFSELAEIASMVFSESSAENKQQGTR